MKNIPFNRPLVLGAENQSISHVFEQGRFSGNGSLTKACQNKLDRLGYSNALLTTSCTSALELVAILLNIEKGDEVIVPSFAFITTANAFASRGAKIVFADSCDDNPCINVEGIEELITDKTKAVVALHYAGIACDMDALNAIAAKHDISIVEDNAQGIAAEYKDQLLGTIGEFGVLSFHETKNVHCGEGGALFVNKPHHLNRAETVWDMGTNRKEFNKGLVPSYGWVDFGSSFYPSEFNAAFLLPQLEQLNKVIAKRKQIWNRYFEAFEKLENEGSLIRPKIPEYANHNGHIFYMELRSMEHRNALQEHLVKHGIQATSHFQSLSRSSFYVERHKGQILENADRYSNCILRLPLYYSLEQNEQDHIIETVINHFT